MIKNKRISIAVSIFGLVFSLFSCVDVPEYSETPEIFFNDITFVDVADPYNVDSLILKIDFTDGNGDLGVDGDENYWPYHNKLYYSYIDEITVATKMTITLANQGSSNGFVVNHFSNADDQTKFIEFVKDNYLPKSNGLPVMDYLDVGNIINEPYTVIYAQSTTFKNGTYQTNTEFGNFVNMLVDGVITFKDRKVANLDTLPSFTSPYNCKNWEIIQDFDTVYFSVNPYYNNIFVQYFVEKGNGVYEEFKWETLYPYPDCGVSFNGRFPYLLTNSSTERPLEGTIKYAMTSTGFNQLFSIKRLKLRIYVYDRSLNRSNVIETPPFVLSDIKK